MNGLHVYNKRDLILRLSLTDYVFKSNSFYLSILIGIALQKSVFSYFYCRLFIF